MLNPDPEKFYTLPGAFDVLGREHYCDTWTGAEIAARNLPQPAPTSQILERAGRSSDRERRERAEKTERARKAATMVGGGVRTLRRSQRHPAPLDPQQIQENEREHSARARRRTVEAELRKLLYGNNIPTALLNSQDGRLVNIGSSRWLADEFTVDFASGQAGWTDLEEDRQITYRGLVLVYRQRFDQEVRKPKKSALGVVRQCTEWARALPPEPVWRKPDFVKDAMNNFKGLSQNQARQVWAAEAPNEWKKSGRKSRAP